MRHCACTSVTSSHSVKCDYDAMNTVLGGECCAAIQTLFNLKEKQVVSKSSCVYDLNFYEYEMLIERELFTAFLKTVNNLLRISLIIFSQ